MADSFLSVTVDSKTLEQKMKSLSTDLQTRILNTALREGAKVIQSALSAAAPVRTDKWTDQSTSLPPGALKSDVIIHKIPNTSEYDVKFGKQTAHVARLVDQGHRMVVGGRSKINKRTGRTTGKGKEVGSIAAHPFAREAFETSANAAETAIDESLTDGIKKAWKK